MDKELVAAQLTMLSLLPMTFLSVCSLGKGQNMLLRLRYCVAMQLLRRTCEPFKVLHRLGGCRKAIHRQNSRGRDEDQAMKSRLKKKKMADKTP